MIKAAILWDSFPNYLSRCIETLARQGNVQVLAFCRTEGAFPNVLDQLREYPNIHLPKKGTPEGLFDEMVQFQPQVAIITVTRRGLFARVAAAWRRSGTIVIGATDHWWKGDWRDYANRWVAKIGGFSPYEAVLVPGALGKTYARKLGFPPQAIFEGLYTCDTEVYRPIGLSRHAATAPADWPRVFLFVGQYIHRKGFDILLKAYAAYRRQASNPWELWLVGRGDLEGDIGSTPGVRNLGMKSSSQIAEIMLKAGCFVLPSRVDHWPLVIHEATSAGLPILASSMCGSAVELVRPGFNGYVFPVNDETTLARLLVLMDEAALAQEMGKNSWQIAAQFSPELWVKKILQEIPLFLRGQPLQKGTPQPRQVDEENPPENITGGSPDCRTKVENSSAAKFSR